jgi:cytochrome o ubiquinol oxidase subunit III
MSNPLNIHHKPNLHPDTRIPDPHQDTFSRTLLGFWMYLMTDCLLFGSLFATYAILHHSTFGGPSSRELFSLPLVFAETMILLVSSITCGFGMLSAVKNRKNRAIAFLSITFLLGLAFVIVEVWEFHQFILEGYSWKRSAFLSSFFTLVGTHGLHVSVGLLWIIVLIGQLFKMGVTINTFRRFAVFTFFWHFLDLVWIFIFTFVYLMGVI